jgi:hypothetical protein
LAEAIGVTEDAGGLGDDGIAVAGGAGKCLSGGIPIETAGVADGDTVREVVEAEAGELLFKGASVFGDNFLGDGVAEVGEAEAVFGEIGEGAVETRKGIEGESVGDAALGEDAFFLLGGGGSARTNSEIDAVGFQVGKPLQEFGFWDHDFKNMKTLRQ